MTKEIYAQWVKEESPNSKSAVNAAKAFAFGGGICVIGQLFIFLYETLGAGEKAPVLASLSLVVLSAILTGMNVYDDIAKHAGAGTLVPITGFANGVCASAVEFQKEGQVFGIGCQIFKIAGPVILYGIFSSWVLGFIYWLF